MRAEALGEPRRTENEAVVRTARRLVGQRGTRRCRDPPTVPAVAGAVVVMISAPAHGPARAVVAVIVQNLAHIDVILVLRMGIATDHATDVHATRMTFTIPTKRNVFAVRRWSGTRGGSRVKLLQRME
jgi:hypothetical protein